MGSIFSSYDLLDSLKFQVRVSDSASNLVLFRELLNRSKQVLLDADKTKLIFQFQSRRYLQNFNSYLHSIGLNGSTIQLVNPFCVSESNPCSDVYRQFDIILVIDGTAATDILKPNPATLLTNIDDLFPSLALNSKLSATFYPQENGNLKSKQTQAVTSTNDTGNGSLKLTKVVSNQSHKQLDQLPSDTCSVKIINSKQPALIDTKKNYSNVEHATQIESEGGFGHMPKSSGLKKPSILKHSFSSNVKSSTNHPEAKKSLSTFNKKYSSRSSFMTGPSDDSFHSQSGPISQSLSRSKRKQKKLILTGPKKTNKSKPSMSHLKTDKSLDSVSVLNSAECKLSETVVDSSKKELNDNNEQLSRYRHLFKRGMKKAIPPDILKQLQIETQKSQASVTGNQYLNQSNLTLSVSGPTSSNVTDKSFFLNHSQVGFAFLFILASMYIDYTASNSEQKALSKSVMAALVITLVWRYAKHWFDINYVSDSVISD